MEAFKENIVDGMIYTFHFQRLPAAAAHSMLTQMIGADSCTLQYVEGLYQRIENKKFSLKKPQLLDLPEHFLRNVIGNLDGKSRAVVRKASKTFRALVDDNPLRLKYLSVQFNRNPKSISLRFDGQTITYYEKEDGCLVKVESRFITGDGGREQFINGKIKDLVLDDMKTILINPKLELEKLSLTKVVSFRFEPSFDEFVQMFSSLEHKVHVEHFDWELFQDTGDLMKIFNTMKPSTLKSLTSRALDWGGHNSCINLDERLFDLPQWKGLKKLKCTCNIEPKNFIYLAQFEKVVLTRGNCCDPEEITGEIIMAMKDKLLENEHLNQIIIVNLADRGVNPVEDLEPVLHPFQSPTNPCWAQFDYPNSDKKLLFRVFDQHIWFKGPCYECDEWEEKDIGIYDYASEDENEDEEVSDGEAEDLDMSEPEPED